MTKADIRKLYKEKRNTISLLQKQKWDDLLLINFQKIKLPYLNFVHTYIANEKLKEIETENIVRYLQFINPALQITAPKSNIETGVLEDYTFTEQSKLVINNFGIEEPAEGEIISTYKIDIALIPLLAFDKKGYRVGYGKGFYDKYLNKCRKDILKIGLSYFDAIDCIDDIDQFDIPLNYCVTPQTLYHF